MRVVPALGLVALALFSFPVFATEPKEQAKPPASSPKAGKAPKEIKAPKETKAKRRSDWPPKSGIKTPGILINADSLKSEAEFAVPDDALASFAGGTVYALSASANSAMPIEAKANKLEETLPGLKAPCTGAVSAFGSLWLASCAEGKIVRFDPKTKKSKASVEVQIAKFPHAMAASGDSVWVLSDGKTTLSRIDPEQNRVVAETRLPPDCNSLAFGESALWVTCPDTNKVLRVDPATNLIANTIGVAGKPSAVAIGEGSVWAYCLTEGKVERIDPKTNKIATTIETKAPATRGDLAAGEGSVWLTSNGFPLTRIDPGIDKVVQQFAGSGGGSIAIGLGSLWVGNLDQKTMVRLDPKRVRATLAE